MEKTLETPLGKFKVSSTCHHAETCTHAREIVRAVNGKLLDFEFLKTVNRTNGIVDSALKTACVNEYRDECYFEIKQVLNS